MKILVFSYFDKRSKDKYSFEEIAKLTQPSKEEYCKIHGYDFINYEIQEYWREIGWYKINVIKEKLKDYDYIMYIEADCLITNYNIKIEDVALESDFTVSRNVISKGWEGINCGNLIIKNSQWSVDFINKLDNKKEFYHDSWAEQRALINELENIDILEKGKHINFTSMRQMGGFYHQWYEKDRWKHGDWIIHLAGCSNEFRYNMFNFLKDKIVKMPDYKIPFEPFV
jgi:Protein of unknown function, DUF273